MLVRTIGVIGCGLMGSGIVEVCAVHGYDVIIYGRNQDRLPACRAGVERSLERAVSRGKLPQREAAAALERIHSTAHLADLVAADLVIESVSEDLGLKRELFATLDKLLRPEAILATNTSSLSVSEIATATGRPDRVLGMHFFNPVPVMRLLELVRGLDTSDETMLIASKVGWQLGKTTITSPDSPGFIVNRLLIPYLVEAVAAFEQGLAPAATMDDSVRLGMAHPLGPLALADLIGLDTTLAIADVLYRAYGDPRFKAPPLLRRFVAAGRLGRKAGQGFYEYRR